MEPLRGEALTWVEDREEWVTGDHATAVLVLRDPRFSSNPCHSGKEASETGEPESILLKDPPDHTRLRRLVSPAFNGPAIAEMESWIRAKAMELLDGCRSNRVDLARELAEPLPLAVICRLLGLEDDAVRFSAWGRELVGVLQGVDPPVGEGDHERVAEELGDFVDELVTARRRAPGADVLSELAAAEEAGDRLTHGELTTMCITLLFAGFVTTVNLINNTVLALLNHPDQMARLRVNPSLAANAIEEVLRFDGGMPATARFATTDVDLSGRIVRRGERIVVLVAAANRDSAVFEDPEHFDVGRANASRHLTFGAGIHHCLGAPLARLEARVALEVLLSRFGSIEFAAEPRRSREGAGGWIDRLPVFVTR